MMSDTERSSIKDHYVSSPVATHAILLLGVCNSHPVLSVSPIPSCLLTADVLAFCSAPPPEEEDDELLQKAFVRAYYQDFKTDGIHEYLPQIWRIFCQGACVVRDGCGASHVDQSIAHRLHRGGMTIDIDETVKECKYSDPDVLEEMISDCPLCGNALDKYIDPISNRKPYCDSNDALDNLLSGSNKNVVLSEVPNVVAQPCAKKKHVPKVTQDHRMSRNNGFTSVINVRRNPNAPKCTTISHALHLAYDCKSRCKEKADIVLKTATDDITFADPLYPRQPSCSRWIQQLPVHCAVLRKRPQSLLE